MGDSDSLWILTINDDSNYGNRLQNFALQQVLSRYSTRVGTVRCLYQRDSMLITVMKNILRPIKHFLCDTYGKGAILKSRYDAFLYFNARYIHEVRLSSTSKKNLSHVLDSNSAFVIGSDQVWNDRIIDDWVRNTSESQALLKLRLGFFFPQGRIISYAASFGIDQVKQESEPIFAKLLPRISSISVREDRGVELIQELSGRKATVVLDPTLMLTTDQWRSIIPGDFVDDDEKYVLTYFLGKPSPEQDSIIRQYAKEHGCKIRRMLDLDDPATYAAGPREFVELFSKTQYVFTDSYHACCFSILFNKQFKVFNRAGFSGKTSMNSRMTTLFRLFDLDDSMGNDAKLDRVNYDHVNALLEQHREESRAWLEQALTKIGVIG